MGLGDSNQLGLGRSKAPGRRISVRRCTGQHSARLVFAAGVIGTASTLEPREEGSCMGEGSQPSKGPPCTDATSVTACVSESRDTLSSETEHRGPDCIVISMCQCSLGGRLAQAVCGRFGPPLRSCGGDAPNCCVGRPACKRGILGIIAWVLSCSVPL